MAIFMDDVAPGQAQQAVEDGREAGDCLRACVASITEVDVEEVPHFAQYRAGDARLWWWALVGWCSAYGWDVELVERDDRGRRPEELPQGWCLAMGPSPRGHRHVIVAFDGRMAHDPHPSRVGLVCVDTWIRLTSRA